MTCLFDPFGCLETGFWSLMAMVPWWAWAVAAVLLIALVWRLFGWPGLVALGAVAGFILGRRETPEPDYEDGGDSPFHRPRSKPVKRTAKRGYQPPRSLNDTSTE